MTPDLTPIRERQRHDFGSIPVTYRYLRVSGWATSIMSLLLVFPLQDMIAHRYFNEAIFTLIFMLLLLFLAAFCFSFTLTINSSGITRRSIMGTREILFEHITSIQTTAATTHIQSGTQKIILNSRMPDYSLIRDYIQRRAPANRN